MVITLSYFDLGETWRKENINFKIYIYLVPSQLKCVVSEKVTKLSHFKFKLSSFLLFMMESKPSFFVSFNHPSSTGCLLLAKTGYRLIVQEVEKYPTKKSTGTPGTLCWQILPSLFKSSLHSLSHSKGNCKGGKSIQT